MVSPLPKYLAISCALLILWACLYPFSGWLANGLPLFDYLIAPWPKYFRVEDLVVNVAGYVPLGFVLVPALPQRLKWPTAIALATLLGALLSFTVETTQNFLPSRVSSNVDLGSNTLGAFLGALAGAVFGRHLFGERGVHRWRMNNIVSGRMGDIGLVLVALWLLVQCIPDRAAFTAGDLRSLLDLPAPLTFQPRPFATLEAAMVSTSLLAAGLFVRCMMQTARLWPILLLLVLGLAAKSLATWSFHVPSDPLLWLTPGTRTGLLIGAALLGLTLCLPRVHQHALAGVALLGAVTLTNLLPESPYFSSYQLISGNFQNFHGLAGLVSGAWPFLALAYLSALGLWRGEHLHHG